MFEVKPYSFLVFSMNWFTEHKRVRTVKWINKVDDKDLQVSWFGS